MLKSKNQVTLFVNYSYNSFYDFRFSKNTYREQKVMCQNMGFSILYGGYIWTSLVSRPHFSRPPEKSSLGTRLYMDIPLTDIHAIGTGAC